MAAFMSVSNGSIFASFAAALAIMSSGCVTNTQPRTQPVTGTRIVLIDTLDSAVMNAHMGMTVFGNYNEPIENDWNVPASAEAYVTALFKAEGNDVVKVEPDPQRLDALRKGAHLRTGWSEFHVDPTFAAWFKSLLDGNRATAVIVLRGAETQVVPNSVARYSGYGVLSIMGFKPSEATLFSLVYADVLTGEPLAMMRHEGPVRCRKRIPTASMDVANLKDLTAKDLQPFREDLVRIVNRGIGHDISASGLLRKTVPACEFEK